MRSRALPHLHRYRSEADTRSDGSVNTGRWSSVEEAEQLGGGGGIERAVGVAEQDSGCSGRLDTNALIRCRGRVLGTYRLRQASELLLHRCATADVK
jgi:hypothetical protein